MTALEAFQKLRYYCNEYHVKLSTVKLETVDDYPLDNIEKALKAIDIISRCINNGEILFVVYPVTLTEDEQKLLKEVLL